MGHVSKNAASVLSSFSGRRLKSGTPIIAGAPDFISALIGTGTKVPGDVCNRAGSSEGINVCAVEPVQGESSRLFPHAVEGLWNIGIVINSSGRLFESYRKHAGLENVSYENLLKELIPSTKDTNMFYTSFTAPQSTLEQGRAVLGAIGFSVRSALKTLKDLGFPISKMRVSGGQSKNPRWNQLKADISGVSLMVPMINDGELAGNAVLAVLALEGINRHEQNVFDEKVNKMISFREVYEPFINNAPFWEERYNDFCINKPRFME